MADKSSGFDFDRQVFVQPEPPKSRPAPPIAGILFALIAIGAIGFLAYKLLPQNAANETRPDARSLAEVNNRLTEIEKRLDRLEALRQATVGDRRNLHAGNKASVLTAHQRAASERTAKPVRLTTTPGLSAAAPATVQRLAAVQKGVAALQSDQAENQEAWQATTDRMADMAGQVGTQSVEVLRNRDELNEVLADTEMEGIPFELYRGANPQTVGPVSLALKSLNARHKTYTLCVYIQNSCTELKNRTLHEVVQFVLARNSAPLRVIGTKLRDDVLVGFLEVPRGQVGH